MKSLRIGLALVLLTASVSVACAATRPAARDKLAKNGEFPSFDDVKQMTEAHFSSLRNYEPHDLITVSNVNLLFAKLDKMGWKVVDRREILKSILPESDWLSRQFATRNGRKFMRQIAELPDGYDRIDRLRRMPYGDRRVAEMMRDPGGSKMIEYMTSTGEGKNLGRMLSRGTNGRDFNKPTGRLYTQLDLLKRLKKSYEAEEERRLSMDSKKSKPDDSADKKPAAQKNADDPQQPPKPDVDPFDRKETPHG